MNSSILIVEDSKTYNFTLKDNLEPYGFNIYQAFTLSQATQILTTTKIEYVILDLNLPDGEGDDLLEVINLQDENLKIMVLSASSDIQKRNYLFENGVVEYFSKDTKIPILINEIVELINSLSENQNKNILIVDDSSFVRKSLKRILLSKNYNVYEAKDPLIGLQILQEGNINIDLVYLDLEMPKMNGDVFLDIVKADNKIAHIPILVLSGSVDRVKYASVLRHGALDFIKKPFFAEEILLKTDLHIKQSKYIKQIEIQAQELHEYKRALDLSDIISKTDIKGKITYVNKKFCEISGYNEYELIGKSHNVVRHPDVHVVYMKICGKN